MIGARGRHTDTILLAVLPAGGLSAILILKPPLYADPHALGMHAVALLVPYVAAMTYAVAAVLLGRFDRTRALVTLALFAALALPFADLFASPIVHLEADDSYRYSVYAHHMLHDRTLWGSDGLLHGRRHFVDQPGYRYYLAAAIALLGGEHRGLQLFDTGLLLSVALVALRVSRKVRLDRGFAIFLLAAAPYAAKNVLYGYTEWFAVSLFSVAAVCLLTNRVLSTVVVLALVPFVRQNLLLVSLVMAGYTIVRSRRWWLVAPFLLMLGLPLYHNLYYAGEWRFFVENTGALVQPTGEVRTDLVAALDAVLSRLPHYLGYAPGQKLTTLAVAILFAPLGSAMVIYVIARARGGRRALFTTIAVLTIAPTLVFGSGSFPRFEYVNLSVILLAYGTVLGLRTNIGRDFSRAEPT